MLAFFEARVRGVTLLEGNRLVNGGILLVFISPLVRSGFLQPFPGTSIFGRELLQPCLDFCFVCVLVPSCHRFCAVLGFFLPQMLGENSLLVRSGFLRPSSENVRE